MSFNLETKNALEAKLDKKHIKRNPRGFDYVEGWHAIAEANRIFGFDGWTRELINLKQLAEPYQDQKNRWCTHYMATVRIQVGPDIIRDGTGYGSGIDANIGSSHESAIKEAETDSMKRALMTFGNPFGLALYDKTRENVEDAPARPPETRPAPKAAPVAHHSANGEVLSDWPAFIADFKTTFAASPSALHAREFVTSQAKPLRALKADWPVAHRMLYEWMATEGEKLSVDAV